MCVECRTISNYVRQYLQNVKRKQSAAIMVGRTAQRMVVETKTAKKPETEALHFTSKFILSVYQSVIAVCGA